MRWKLTKAEDMNLPQRVSNPLVKSLLTPFCPLPVCFFQNKYNKISFFHGQRNTWPKRYVHRSFNIDVSVKITSELTFSLASPVSPLPDATALLDPDWTRSTPAWSSFLKLQIQASGPAFVGWTGPIRILKNIDYNQKSRISSKSNWDQDSSSNHIGSFLWLWPPWATQHGDPFRWKSLDFMLQD